MGLADPGYLASVAIHLEKPVVHLAEDFSLASCSCDPCCLLLGTNLVNGGVAIWA